MASAVGLMSSAGAAGWAAHRGLPPGSPAAGFAIGALMGLLIRRVVPAIAATLAAVAGLLLVARLYLQQHYIAPLIAKNPFNPPVSAWIVNGWWTKGGTTISQSTMNQIMNTMFRRIMPAILPKNVNDNDIKFYKGAANSQVLKLPHPPRLHAMDQLPARQPVLAVPVDRGRLAARAVGAAHRRDRLAGGSPGDLSRPLAASSALAEAWDGTAAVDMGTGGSIPFIAEFQGTFPGAHADRRPVNGNAEVEFPRLHLEHD